MKKVKDERVTLSAVSKLTGKSFSEEVPMPTLQRSTSPQQNGRKSRLASSASSESSSVSTVTSSVTISRPPFNSVSQNTPGSWKPLRAKTSTPPSVSSRKDVPEKPRLGLMQELLEARKENSAVKSSNSQLKEELQKYKSVVQSLENQEYALQSHCSVADETKLVTSKVLQSLTQQLLTERSEKKELMEMLEQEGKELQCVIADKEELEKRLQEVHQKVNELEMAKQELETSKHDLEDVKAHLQSQLGASMEAARSHDTNMQKMHLELQAAHDEITALSMAFTNIKNTLSRVNSAREAAEAQLAALKADKSQDQEAWQAEKEELQSHMMELLRDRELQVSELQTQHSQATQSLQDLQRQFTAVNHALAGARKELAGARKELAAKIKRGKTTLVCKLISGALGVVSTLLVHRLHQDWRLSDDSAKQPKGIRLLYWRVSVSKA